MGVENRQLRVLIIGRNVQKPHPNNLGILTSVFSLAPLALWSIKNASSHVNRYSFTAESTRVRWFSSSFNIKHDSIAFWRSRCDSNAQPSD